MLQQVFCVDKGYWFIDEIICKNTKLTEADFQEPYPNTALWSMKYHIEIDNVNPATIAGTDGSRTPIKQMVEKIHVFNATIQKKLLAEYEQKSKVKSQQQSKLISDQKSLITILFGQCDDATRTKVTLGNTKKSIAMLAA